MLQDMQLRLESVSLEVKALRALVAETREPEGPPIHAPLPCPREPAPGDAEQTAPTIDLDMATRPLDSDDDDMEESGVGPWRTVASNQKKRNKVVMKLKGTAAYPKEEACGAAVKCRAGKLEKLLLSSHGKAYLKWCPACLKKLLRDFCLRSIRYRNLKRALRVRVQAKGMGLSISVGNAYSFLFGIQAKRVSFDGSSAEVSGPQPAKPGLFSFRETRLPFFTGVVAGSKDYRKRRWQSVGGKDKVAQVVSGSDVLDRASGSSGKTESVTAQPGAELEVLCSSNEDDFSSVLSEVCCPGENCSDDALSEVPRCEDDVDGALSQVLCCEDDSDGT